MLNVEYKKCTGCRLCAENCPKKCITMEENEEGFLYPKITDPKKCINCDICNKMCPTNIKIEKNEKKYYALQLKECKKLKKCASGGAFTTLALKVISLGGTVCGVCQENKELKFEFVTKEKDLDKLMGSKYYQCNLDKYVYDYLKEINSNELILFSGTPCQTAAIESKFRNKFGNKLITVEIICQGVPSHNVINQFYKEKEEEKGKKIKNHFFRSKDKYVGRNYLNKYVYLDNEIEYLKGSDDSLTKSFQNKIFLRESCYNCNFTQNNRLSDFTIGDLWNYDLKDKSFDFKKGISVLVVNNERAQKIIEDCNEICLLEEISADSVSSNVPFNKSVKRPLSRNFSYKLLSKHIKFKNVVNTCCVNYNIKLCIKKILKRS